MTQRIKIVFTDLDGTLFNQSHRLSEKNLSTLQELGKKNVIRVVATGRSLYSANKIVENSCPVDYLIFSSGAGIMNWQTKEIIFKESIPEKDYKKVVTIFIQENVHFMMHKQIPDNHAFYYWGNPETNDDFFRRLMLYQKYAEPYTNSLDINHEITQFVAIFPPDELTKFEKIRGKISNTNKIRTTSPLDYQSVWLEIFPQNVSKGLAAKWLCDYLSIHPLFSLAVGNDYNDIDLLDWATYSFITANAPQDLKDKYNRTDSNEDDGFTKAILEVEKI
jgi:hypothetical protein